MLLLAARLFLALPLLFTFSAEAAGPPDPLAWTTYAQHFFSSDGRVIDAGSGGISHSEGQGTALLLAVRNSDRDRFAAIWDWTKANLAVRNDALLAWSWRPEKIPHVVDKNNATDGDLLVAWALAEAWQQWQVPAYRDAAVAIGNAILGKLLRRTPIGEVLLPGANGFETGEGIVINLSYAVLPAFKALSGIDSNPVWGQLTEAHHALLAKARFGRFSLPPDWLFVPKKWNPDAAAPSLVVWTGKPSRFGFDAIRIPLYLAWSGADGHELWPFLAFWSYFDPLPFHPPWIDLNEDAVPLSSMAPGFISVRRLAEAAQAGSVNGPHPLLIDNSDYFSASLIMLSDLAWRDRGF